MKTFRAVIIDTRTEHIAVSIGCGAEDMGYAEAYFHAACPDGWKVASIEQVSR